MLAAFERLSEDGVRVCRVAERDLRGRRQALALEHGNAQAALGMGGQHIGV